MERIRTSTKSITWAVTFPEEKMLVKRPSLKRICQDNADLAELLSYFIYEVSREATMQGIDPRLVREATIYRTQEEVSYGIDYNTTQKILRQNIGKLDQLGFLQSSRPDHAYTVLVENIRLALAQHAQGREKPTTKLKLPPSKIHLTEPSHKDIQPHSHLARSVDRPDDMVKLPCEAVDLPVQSGKSTAPANTTEVSPQADSLSHESAGRYNRDNREIKRDSNRDGEADAVATAPSFFPVSQSPLSPLSSFSSSHKNHENYEQSVRQKEIVPFEQNAYVGQDASAKREAKIMEKPVAGTSPTVEAFLTLADHYRGYRLAHSAKQNSPYRLALEAATTFMNRKKTLAEVDAVFAYMKGVDERFCDDWWPMQTVDIWHVMRHFDSMTRKMAHRRAYAPGRHEGPQGIQPGQSFPMYQTAEVMEMPLEERKLYLARQREQMQQKSAQ
jgi:hypothetical protein